MRAFARPEAKRSIIGSTNAAVLPVPVWAIPSRSEPVRMMGIACCWMGVGPKFARPGLATQSRGVRMGLPPRRCPNPAAAQS